MQIGAITLNNRLILPLAYMLGLFLLSSLPGDSTDTPAETLLAWIPPNVQNLLHIPVFAGLTCCWFWALSTDEQAEAGKTLQLSVFFALCYAAFDEFHQTMVPGRYGSLTDLLLDFIGIVAAAIFIKRRSKASTL